MRTAATIRKQNPHTTEPLVSLILLDWSVRERFHTLDWLAKQDVSRDQYEIVWVELYDRVVPQVMEKADVVITCAQRGMYHKHIGYNVGLLHAKGQIITICDSDAVFPPDFVESVIQTFRLNIQSEPSSIVLMHDEWRTTETYPNDLSDLAQLQDYGWKKWENVGACMSVRRLDAIRFGGFDEHRSFRGYICGPYDLGWRLVNAGIPEIWHDESVALWHFAHPKPFGRSNPKMWRETTYPHVEGHALTAVEAFSAGRLLPHKESSEIHKLRMSMRRIGSRVSERYAWMTGSAGFPKWKRLALLPSLLDPIRLAIRYTVLEALERLLGQRRYNTLRDRWRSARKHSSDTH